MNRQLYITIELEVGDDNPDCPPGSEESYAVALAGWLGRLIDRRALAAVYTKGHPLDGEHPEHTEERWRLEVETHCTRMGYWEWVLSCLEAEHIAQN